MLIYYYLLNNYYRVSKLEIQLPYKLYNYNTPEYEVTGSGGRQAPAVLAEQIKNVKQRRAKQEDQGDLGLTTIQDTGLQFA